MWTEDQRKILTITVRGEQLKLDPLPITRRYRGEVRKVGAEAFGAAIKTLLEGDETDDIAKLVMPCIYKTFDWKSYSEDQKEGYTEAEAINALTQFIEWLIESKKKGENSPSSAGSTGASEETRPTPNTLDSSLPEMSSKAVEPGQLPSAAGSKIPRSKKASS